MIIPTVFCLMGPTASGKTRLAIELAQQLPYDIISVDSAMVYRGMDIGTAKPTAAELALAPHRLIDIADPADPYSAGQFCLDATAAIEDIIKQQRIPLLVGGTMLYFRALQQGLSPLPSADSTVRQQLSDQAAQLGWQALHQRLAQIDPAAAARIQPQDAQRIQRALEIHQLTGLSATAFYQQAQAQKPAYRFVNAALLIEDRELLHQQIATRFANMLEHGFIEEVARLNARGDLHPDLPSMRSVGYRQVWEYLAGQCSMEDMQQCAVAATRQLAKRQLTWLRSWPDVTYFLAQQRNVQQLVKNYFMENI